MPSPDAVLPGRMDHVGQSCGLHARGRLLGAKEGSVRPRTYESYDLNVRRLKPLIGRIRLSTLTPAAIERAYADLIERGLSRRSVVQVHTVLHKALERAVQWGSIGRNPSEAVSVPRPERNEMHTLSEDEVRRFFPATQDHRLHALWVLLASTGLRVGEATGLRWDEFDLDQNRLIVRRALQRQKGVGLVFVGPKTTKSRRTVYFPEGTAQALREHRRQQIEEKLAWALPHPNPRPRWPAARSCARPAAHRSHPLPGPRREPQDRPGAARPQHSHPDARHLLPRHASHPC